MCEPLLHVVSFVLRRESDVSAALRHLLRLHPSDGESHPLLLFADLFDAPGAQMPEDALLIRKLQSGVMAMNARRPGRFFLLVRTRVWSDAARMYLGAGQPTSCRRVIAQLMQDGRTQASFEIATLAPASLRNRFSAVLFSSLAQLCTPDTPARMLRMLSAAPAGMIGAPIRPLREYPESVFARLNRVFPFSLSSLHAARVHARLRQGLCLPDAPVMYTAKALLSCKDMPARPVPIAADCPFVRCTPPSLRQLYHEFWFSCLHERVCIALLAPLQLLTLLGCALSGQPWLIATALLPELWALVHPRQWPGVLLRAALLPVTALVSLDALSCRLLARSPLVRLRIPQSLMSAAGCVLLGAVLLPAAIASAGALTQLLPLYLLWLSAPLLLSALSSPTMERIPLSDEQRAQLRALAEHAYFSIASDRPTPALRMLSACAGCMLDLLEPDEAARQVQTLLTVQLRADSFAERASLLVCAQYLRERMADCDAALRELPALLEKHARKTGADALFAPDAVSSPQDALFLPLGPAKAMAPHPVTLPLTHPHTYLQRALLSGNGEASTEPSIRFLALTAAALGHPFHALLMRSPVAAPQMLLLST